MFLSSCNYNHGYVRPQNHKLTIHDHTHFFLLLKKKIWKVNNLKPHTFDLQLNI